MTRRTRTSTPRKASQGAGAKRKAPKKNTAGMVSALEDSAGTPSRKSTRGSTNHAKAAETRYPAVIMKTRSPSARAARNQARNQKARGTGRR